MFPIFVEMCFEDFQSFGIEVRRRVKTVFEFKDSLGDSLLDVGGVWEMFGADVIVVKYGCSVAFVGGYGKWS